MMNAAEKTDKVESFLDSNPEFLACYLRRRMRIAVTTYLENNPQFLSEYLDSQTQGCNGFTTDNYTEAKSLKFTHSASELHQSSPKPVLRCSQSTSNATLFNARQNSVPFKEPKQSNFQTRAYQFSLHGQQNNKREVGLDSQKSQNNG